MPLVFAALCAFAQAQDLGVDRLVAGDARRLLQHEDPVVRGEAALICAPGADAALQERILRLAADPAPPARQRALLALGLTPSASAVQVLDAALRTTSARGDDDAAAAAFALGMCPAELAQTAQARLFASIAQGSWKRQRDTLLAALLGMGVDVAGRDPAPLRRLLDDDSNRDPEVRALLLRLLLPIDASLQTPQLEQMLERASDAEREVMLQHWAKTGLPDSLPADRLDQLARTSAAGAVRSASLAVLTRQRTANAAQLATTALRSDDPRQAAQGMRSLLQLGGGLHLAELERRVLDETNARCKAALLQHHAAPLSPALRDHCVALAADARQPTELRVVAACALARQQPDRAAPLLRDLFAATDDQPLLLLLATSMQHGKAESPAIDRLLRDGEQLTQRPDHFLALLRTSHPGAEREVLRCLRDRDASVASLRVVLRTWRRARVLDTPEWRPAAVPAALRTMLGG